MRDTQDFVDIDARMVDVDPVGRYAAVIGERRLAYYLAAFIELDKKGPGLHAGWNWAGLLGPVWPLYRKMYGLFAASFLIHCVTYPIYSAERASTAAMYWASMVALASIGVLAVFGNALYLRKVKGILARADRLYQDPVRAHQHAASFGGVNRWVPWVFGGLPAVGIALAIALPMIQSATGPERAASWPEPVQSVAPHQPLRPLPSEVALDNAPKDLPGIPDGRWTPTPPQAQISTAPSQPTRAAPVPAEPRRDPMTPEMRQDLQAAAERAVSDFPYLGTPDGEPAMQKILERRDELIRQGVYPSIALTRAVQAFAPFMAPRVTPAAQ